MNKTETTFVRLTADEKNKLRKLAEKNKRTISNMIRVIITEYLQKTT